MWGISRPAEELPNSQAGLCAKKVYNDDDNNNNNNNNNAWTIYT
jgi:hypothetical protein